MNNTAPQPRKTGTDNTLLYIAIGVVAFFLLGYLLHHYSVVIYRVWKPVVIPLAVFSRWLSEGMLGDVLNPLLNTTQTQAASLVVFLRQTPAQDITYQGFMAVNTFIGKHLLVLLLPVGLYVTIATFRATQGVGKPFQRFASSRQFKRYGLTDTDKNTVASIDDDALYNGEMASAMSCLQYCEAFGIATYDEIARSISAVNQEKAHQVLMTQLGKRFDPNVKFQHGELTWLYDALVSAIPKPHRAEAIQFATTGHLYESTVYLGLLFVAKRFGVIPSTVFLPIKEQYRALWYALISCGRKTVYIEGAAIVAQFEHELTCKLAKDRCKPKSVHIQPAVDALLKALVEEPMETPWNAGSQLWENFDPMRY